MWFELFLSFLVSTTVIITRDGKRFRGEKFKLTSDKVELDTLKLPREEVKRILFTRPFEGKYEGYKMYRVSRLLAMKDSAAKVYNFHKEKYITLIDEGFSRLNPDGTRYFIYHFAGVITKPEGREIARVMLGFSPENEHFKLILARTIKSDGRTIELSPEEVKIIKPSAGLEFYDQDYTVSFNLPEAGVGDIVEYIVVYDVYNPWNKRIYTNSWNFTGTEPVWYSHYTIEVPDTSFYKYIFLNTDTIDVNFKETQRKGFKVFDMWTYKLAGYPEEPYMPAIGDILPRFMGGNQKDWSYIFKWYSDFQKKRMIVSDTIRKLAESIVKDAHSFDDSVALVYYWVQQNIRYISIKGAAASGVSGHSAEETLMNGYGDCTDKSILFTTLLKAIAIEAYPVYIRTNDGPMLVKEIPSYYGNHAISQVFYRDGRYRFLDATGRWSRYPYFWSADHGVWAICAQKDSIYFIDVPPPEDNLRSYKYTIEFENDTLMKLNFYSSYTGDYEAGLKYFWNFRKPDEIPFVMQGMAARIAPGARMVSYDLINKSDIAKPLHIVLNVIVPNYLKKEGKFYLFNPPEVKDRYQLPYIALSSRIYPLRFETSEYITDTMIITFPNNMVLHSLPKPIYDSSDLWIVEGRYEIIQEKPLKLKYIDRYKRYDRFIPSDRYQAFRDALLKLKSFIISPVILRKKGGR